MASKTTFSHLKRRFLGFSSEENWFFSLLSRCQIFKLMFPEPEKYLGNFTISTFLLFFLQKKCLEETLQKRSNYGMDCTHYNNAKWKLSVAWENMMSCCFLLELNRCHGYYRVARFFHLVDRFAVWSGWPWSDLRCELSAGIVGPLPTSANSEGCPTNCWGPPVRHLVVA